MFGSKKKPGATARPGGRGWRLLLASATLTASMVQAQPTDSLLLHLELEGNLLDSSGNLHDGSGFGTLAYSSGVIGMAASFSGDDSVTFPSVMDTAFSTNDFSVTFWFNVPIDRQASLIGKRTTCAISPFVDIRSHAGSINFAISDSTGNHALNAPRSDGWRFYAAVREAGVMRLYLDGALRSERSIPLLDLENSSLLGISISPCIGVDGTETLLGELDDLRIYKRALSAAEVATFTGFLFGDSFETGDTAAWSSAIP